MTLLRAMVVVLALALARADAAAAKDLIAYEALTGGVFTIRPDGNANREIVPDAHGPVWSRDGSRLLFSLGFDGGLWSSAPDGTDLRLMIRPANVDVPAGGPAFAATDASWSPSGRRVAFVATAEDASERSVDVVCTAAVDGTRLRVLRRGYDPEWVSDRRIAFTVTPRRRSDGFWNRIATMRRDGTRLRFLLDDRRAYRSDLGLSPDRGRLAFVEQANQPGYSPGYVRVITLRTGRIRTVPIEDTAAVAGFTWTPGGRIAYVPPTLALGGRAAPSSMFSIRLSGADRRQLFTLPYEENRGLWTSEPAWQPAHDDDTQP